MVERRQGHLVPSPSSKAVSSGWPVSSCRENSKVHTPPDHLHFAHVGGAVTRLTRQVLHDPLRDKTTRRRLRLLDRIPCILRSGNPYVLAVAGLVGLRRALRLRARVVVRLVGRIPLWVCTKGLPVPDVSDCLGAGEHVGVEGGQCAQRQGRTCPRGRRLCSYELVPAFQVHVLCRHSRWSRPTSRERRRRCPCGRSGPLREPKRPCLGAGAEWSRFGEEPRLSSLRRSLRRPGLTREHPSPTREVAGSPRLGAIAAWRPPPGTSLPRGGGRLGQSAILE